MNREDIKLRFCKYKISKFHIIIPGMDEPFEIDEAHMGNWSIEKDYENYFFPFFEVRCIVPDEIYSKVMDTSEDVYIDLRIDYAYFEDMYEMEPAAMVHTFDKLLEDRFYAFIANKSPKLTDALIGEKNKDQDNDEGTYSQYSYDNKKSLVMGLYRSEHIFNVNQIVNKVLSRATATDGIAWILKKINAERVIMAPSDNGTIYDQLVIPPLIAPQAIMNVVNSYGLYKEGGLVFFDYDRIFVITKKVGCHAYTRGEHLTVYLTSFPGSSDQSVMKSGYYYNNEEKYLVINILGNSISISNQAMFDDQLSGSNIISIDSNTGEITHVEAELSVSEKSPSQNGIVNKVVVTDTGTTSSVEAAKSNIEQAQNVMNILMENINIQALEPNKDFVFTTDNTKYEKYCGHYRLVNMSAAFTKESEFYSCMCTATFVGGQKEL